MKTKDKIEFLENLIRDFLDLAQCREGAADLRVLEGQWKYYLEKLKD
jgi:hypothetical protein